MVEISSKITFKASCLQIQKIKSWFFLWHTLRLHAQDRHSWLSKVAGGKISTNIWGTIKNEMWKLLNNPTSAEKVIQRQKSQVCFFAFYRQTVTYHKKYPTKFVDNELFTKIASTYIFSPKSHRLVDITIKIVEIYVLLIIWVRRVFLNAFPSSSIYGEPSSSFSFNCINRNLLNAFYDTAHTLSQVCSFSGTPKHHHLFQSCIIQCLHAKMKRKISFSVKGSYN